MAKSVNIGCDATEAPEPIRPPFGVCWFCHKPIWSVEHVTFPVVRGCRGDWFARAHRECCTAQRNLSPWPSSLVSCRSSGGEGEWRGRKGRAR
jgi:hypothetical protein